MYLMNRLNLHYKNILYQDLLLKNIRSEFRKIKTRRSVSFNHMKTPKISEIIVSLSSKNVLVDHVLLTSFMVALKLITGQNPVKTKSRKSIANFKLRQSQLIGCKVNLRGIKLNFFMDKLLSIVFPKDREFEKLITTEIKTLKTLETSLTISIKDIFLFPELENNYDLFQNINGINITFITTAKSKKEVLLLLSGFQLPIS